MIAFDTSTKSGVLSAKHFKFLLPTLISTDWTPALWRWSLSRFPSLLLWQTPWPKAIWVEKVTVRHQRKPGQELEARTGVSNWSRDYTGTPLTGFLSYTSYTTQRCLSRHGTMHRGLDPHHINQKMPTDTHISSRWRQFLSWGSLFLGVPSWWSR